MIVLGALALAYQGINYTHREKVLDVGPIHATADEQKHIPLPPIVGGLALLGWSCTAFRRHQAKVITEVSGWGTVV